MTPDAEVDLTETNVNVSYVMKTKDCTYWSQEEIDKYGFQVIQFDISA
ncbi:MAG: hypothetical protein ACI4OR_00280 [Alphaproteobacteria bacterium]